MPDRPGIGYMIEDGGEVRGFFGTIHSRRRVRGREHVVCNITSIAVDESYRRHSLALYKRALGAKDVTYTCFSASPQSGEVLRFFKFQELAVEKVIFTPVSGLVPYIRHAREVRLHLSPHRIDAALDPELQRIARDHRRRGAGQLLLRQGDRTCLVITARRGPWPRSFADILFVSDPTVLANGLPLLFPPLLRAHGTVLAGIDRSRFPGPIVPSVVYRKLRPMHFRSASLDATDVDALYSEVVLASA